MNAFPDRLYKLLPAVYRERDAHAGYPLQALLQVITEQVDVVEADIAQLYENWFIETCEDWVVPYIGDLLGYQAVPDAGEPGDVTTLQGQQRNRILIPRRDVANTIRYRRRKGTLALLELLANDVAGWSAARAVEFQTLLSLTQNVRYSVIAPRRTIDLRQSRSLARVNTPFDRATHTVDLRRSNSHRSTGYSNSANVGLFVWRLQPYSVTQTPANCLESVGSHCYTFSILGNDTPLSSRPQPETNPNHIAVERNLPLPISRRNLQTHKTDYYGINKSLQIWVGVTLPSHPPNHTIASTHTQEQLNQQIVKQALPPDQIVVADLSHWHYRPHPGYVAVDPELGRIAFPPGHLPKKGVWVSYQYGFSADLGGGEYDRPLTQPEAYVLYQVSKTPRPTTVASTVNGLTSINAALSRWQADQQALDQQPDSPERQQRLKQLRHAIIEITDSDVYVEQINITLGEYQSLQLRAANGSRPVIRLLDWHTDLPDSLTVQGANGSRFTLDGLLLTGRGIQVEGKLFSVTIRHSTLVPGWGLHCDCEPQRPAEPSLELFNITAQVTIAHSIVGSIAVYQDETRMDPLPLSISDSILDATSLEREALSAPGCLFAPVNLTMQRSTVFGQIHAHAIVLAENCLFDGLVKVARRQQGCLRFCYVLPGSRTPRRYHCQPDLVEQALVEQVNAGNLAAADQGNAQSFERDRVRPQFNNTRYGTPTYCQLAATCAIELTRGADDESEMGVFHALYQPQRAANLRARLAEYTPAGTNIGIFYAS